MSCVIHKLLMTLPLILTQRFVSLNVVYIPAVSRGFQAINSSVFRGAPGCRSPGVERVIVQQYDTPPLRQV